VLYSVMLLQCWCGSSSRALVRAVLSPRLDHGEHVRSSMNAWSSCGRRSRPTGGGHVARGGRRDSELIGDRRQNRSRWVLCGGCFGCHCCGCVGGCSPVLFVGRRLPPFSRSFVRFRGMTMQCDAWSEPKDLTSTQGKVGRAAVASRSKQAVSSRRRALRDEWRFRTNRSVPQC
jgi:hypothetical protein